MQNLISFRALLLVVLISFCNFYNQANAQTHTQKYISTGANSHGFYEYLPQGYNPGGSATYPLIIHIHGIGELGNGSSDLGKLLWAGIPMVINTGGFPVSLTVNGQTHKFIVISPQFVNWPSPVDIDQVINYATANYKVNLSRVYLTGLSMGGGAVWEYAGSGGNYLNRLAAIAPICGASWPEWTRARNIATGNLPVWAFHNDGDGTVPASYTNDYINQINQAPAPNPNAKKTIFPVGGHDAWTNVYNSNYSENGLTVYQWMLQHQKGSTPPAYNNQTPVANAGADQVVAPGANVQLYGSGSDPDGSVASYSWSKVSGPASFTFSNSNVSNPVLSNLTSGVYTFRLTVTDNLGSASSDDVIINVPVTIPAKIEAENYSAMSGIQTEGTLDIGGGLNIGWQDNGDWMDYPVYVPSTGTYTVKFRIASVYAGPQFQLRHSNGTVLTTVTVPSTLNVQTWTTVSAQVSLGAGQQTLRIVTTNALTGWNLNWIEFQSSQSANQPPAVNAGAEQTITLPATSTTLSGSATDADGWISSVQWTQVSGPSNAVFATPWSANSAVSGLVQGSYVFKLSATDNGAATNSSTVTVNVNGTSTAPSSSVKIEAESYASMSGVQTEATLDAGGGLNVGWQDNYDWMDYSVNLSSAGTYTVNFRVASYFAGAQFQFKKGDGTILTTVTVPNTGSFQSWQTISAQVNLPAGQQTLRIVTSNASGGWNINWFEIQGGSSAPLPPPPAPAPAPSGSIRIEAESYSQMYGVQSEATLDAGGGLNIGWQDNNDWMDYSVNMASAGTYSVSFRVASFFSGAQFQLRDLYGAVLATVTVPNTGSFQVWQNVSAEVYLPAGQQTLRIVTTNANGGWNINWWEILSGSTSARGGSASVVEEANTPVATPSLGIYPNPVKDRFMLRINNAKTGKMNIQLIDMKGAIAKQFSLNKANTGILQSYLSIGELSKGQYIIKVTMNDYTETKQLIKQ